MNSRSLVVGKLAWRARELANSKLSFSFYRFSFCRGEHLVQEPNYVLICRVQAGYLSLNTTFSCKTDSGGKG